MNYFLLQQYTNLVDFLGKALGPDYEISLFDLSVPADAIVAISNGYITGRDIGAPLTNTMMQLIAEQEYLKENYHLHYSSIYSGKHSLRSSVLYIKDETGTLVGLLCINFDDSRYQEMSSRLLSLCHPDCFFHSNFSFDSDKMETAQNISNAPKQVENPVTISPDDMIADILNERGIPLVRLTTSEKKEIVVALHERGFFNIKGAIQLASEKLNCSLSTMYRYLNKI